MAEFAGREAVSAGIMRQIIGCYANIKMLERDDAFRHFLSELPKERRQRISSISARGSARRSLGAWTLMYRCLSDLCGFDGRGARVAYGPHGKPFFPDYPDIHFNLSHSGDYCLAALSAGGSAGGHVGLTGAEAGSGIEVGCDVQERRENGRNDSIARRFFTPEERSALSNGSDFASIWARKEAFLKLTGDGVARDMSSFSVEGSAAAARFFDHPIPGYGMCICCDARDDAEAIWIKEEMDY